jgi:hypothetical protein
MQRCSTNALPLAKRQSGHTVAGVAAIGIINAASAKTAPHRREFYRTQD